jgi:hypothetical protein
VLGVWLGSVQAAADSAEAAAAQSLAAEAAATIRSRKVCSPTTLFLRSCALVIAWLQLLKTAVAAVAGAPTSRLLVAAAAGLALASVSSLTVSHILQTLRVRGSFAESQPRVQSSFGA